jgi:hypothetical protein
MTLPPERRQSGATPGDIRLTPLHALTNRTPLIGEVFGAHERPSTGGGPSGARGRAFESRRAHSIEVPRHRFRCARLFHAWSPRAPLAQYRGRGYSGFTYAEPCALEMWPQPIHRLQLDSRARDCRGAGACCTRQPYAIGRLGSLGSGPLASRPHAGHIRSPGLDLGLRSLRPLHARQRLRRKSGLHVRVLRAPVRRASDRLRDRGTASRHLAS